MGELRKTNHVLAGIRKSSIVIKTPLNSPVSLMNAFTNSVDYQDNFLRGRNPHAQRKGETAVRAQPLLAYSTDCSKDFGWQLQKQTTRRSYCVDFAKLFLLTALLPTSFNNVSITSKVINCHMDE